MVEGGALDDGSDIAQADPRKTAPYSPVAQHEMPRDTHRRSHWYTGYRCVDLLPKNALPHTQSHTEGPDHQGANAHVGDAQATQ